LCSTGLDEGIPFIEGEILHTTLLRVKIRDKHGIARGATLPNLLFKYCLYKTVDSNWDCQTANCKQPLQPKFIQQPDPHVFPKTC
jgi:hypothetical protein